MYIVDLDKIKQLREQRGLSITDLSKQLGYQTAHGYYYLEKGRNQISANKLAEIAEALGVEIMALYKEV